MLILFEKVFDSLNEGSVFYIGDILDRLLLWPFADTEQYKAVYFNNLKSGTSAIGNWFLSTDLYEMGKHVGFSQIEIFSQPSDFPYHHFKFDMRFIK